MKKNSLTRTALLFALSIVLSFLESLVVVLPLFPGVKLGLSNVPVMFSLFSISFPLALSLAVAKGIFSLITRGVTAGLLSLFGGVLSVLVMCVLKKLFKDKISLVTTSISGAVTHNTAQLIIVYFLWKTSAVFSLLPILIVSGVVFGSVNAVLLKITLPYLNKTGGIR